MGGGFIGGDGSMQWDFQADKVISHDSIDPGPGIHRHLGRDRTSRDDPFFYVTIRLPVDRDQQEEFLKSLADGLTAGQNGKPVSFRLRIEDTTNNGPISNQIQIFWTSEGALAPGPDPAGQTASPSAATATRSRRTSKRRSTTTRKSKAASRRRRPKRR